MRSLLIFAALQGALMDANRHNPEFWEPPKRTRAQKKNKFLLSDDEVEMLSTMSPKEKKKFLKDRR